MNRKEAQEALAVLESRFWPNQLSSAESVRRLNVPDSDDYDEDNDGGDHDVAQIHDLTLSRTGRTRLVYIYCPLSSYEPTHMAERLGPQRLCLQMTGSFGELHACGHTLLQGLNSMYWEPTSEHMWSNMLREIDARIVQTILLDRAFGLGLFPQCPGYVLAADKHGGQSLSQNYTSAHELTNELPDIWEEIFHYPNPYHDFESEQGLYVRRLYDENKQIILTPLKEKHSVD